MKDLLISWKSENKGIVARFLARNNYSDTRCIAVWLKNIKTPEELDRQLENARSFQQQFGDTGTTYHIVDSGSYDRPSDILKTD